MKSNACKIVFCLLLISCKAQYLATDSSKQMQGPFLYAFKINYFKKLLLEGFNHSDAIQNVLATDYSGYGEAILSMEDYTLIDSLVKIDNKVMAQDSLNRIGRVAEGAQGKHVFTYALYKFQSKWLDSLAKERFKIFAQNH